MIWLKNSFNVSRPIPPPDLKGQNMEPIVCLLEEKDGKRLIRCPTKGSSRQLQGNDPAVVLYE